MDHNRTKLGGGLRPGQLCLLDARPEMGTSGLVMSADTEPSVGAAQKMPNIASRVTCDVH